MNMQRIKKGTAEIFYQMKRDIEALIISRFEKAMGKRVQKSEPVKKIDWMPASEIEYAIEGENAGFLVLVVPGSDFSKWDKQIPIQHEYRMYRDMAAYDFDRLYVAVLCGLDLFFKVIERDEEVQKGIIALEEKHMKNPLF
jgi:predicted phage-related endonuclease